MPGGRFTDRTVMVFGAAGALGAGLAAVFAGEGAGVIGVDRAEPSGDRRLRYPPRPRPGILQPCQCGPGRSRPPRPGQAPARVTARHPRLVCGIR